MDVEKILDEDEDPYIRKALAMQALMHAHAHTGRNQWMLLDAMKLVRDEMKALTQARAAEENTGA